LAPLQTADLLVTVIGDVLQVNFFASGDPRTQLFHFLSQKETLLVLDNFEHLLDGAETVSALLTAAPHIKVLITSRQRLDLQEEWVYEIGGLPLPEINEAVPLTENSAITLFRQSAQRADSRYTLTTEDKEHVVRICRLVGGMPLAIELAASWVRLLSCAEIAGEIERGLDFLAVSLRNIPERHRSIQTVFNHTWHLLTPLEQQTLARLSVFRGGFTREAAQQVTQATLPLLSALVDKSLVRRIETNRYDLHELIRQYAYEQLAKSNEFEDAGNRHFAYFLALAEESRVKLRGSELILWINLLERDYDNFRCALQWSLKKPTEMVGQTPFEAYRGQNALRLTSALYLFWKIRVYWGNGRNWLHRALNLADEAPPTFERIEAMKSAALLAVEQMDLADAKQLAERALVLARELGDAQRIALILNSLSIVLWKQKEYEAARNHCEEALTIYRKLDLKISLADALQLLGRIASQSLHGISIPRISRIWQSSPGSAFPSTGSASFRLL
jgi:predicted ATPase